MLLSMSWARRRIGRRAWLSSCPSVVALAILACGRPGLSPEVAPAPSAVGAPSWQPDRSTFDASAEPCGDFYQYVCGGWAKPANIPADRPTAAWARDAVRDATDRALQQLLGGSDHTDDAELGRLRTFHASCMAQGEAADKAGEATLAIWLGRIEGIKRPSDVMAVVRELHRNGVDALFQYSGEPDRTDRHRHRGEIHQGTLGARLSLYRETGPEADSRRQAYRAHVVRMFELSGTPHARAEQDGSAVLAIETELAAVALSFVERFDPDVSEHPTMPSALTGLAPHVDWPAYLALVEHPAERMLNVTSPAYLKAMDGVLAHRPLQDLRAYLRWRLLDTVAPALPARLAAQHYDFHATPGVQRRPRASECQLETLKAMGVELSRQFAVRVLGADARDRATAVAQRVRNEMADSIQATAWLTPAARAASADKLRMLDLKVGFPRTWPATGTFPIRDDSFLENLLAARSFEQQRSWNRARAERRRDSWEMTVHPNEAHGMAAARLVIPNGFPDPFSNSIVLTAASLRPPLFDGDAPPEVGYGTLGFLVGHELVHVIETHEIDSQGEFHDAWTPQDIAARETRTACVVEQANQFIAIDAIHLDGRKTLAENVADLSGVAHAYAAMARELGPRVAERGVDGFTPAQRFFLAYAQGWCTADRPEYARESVRSDGHAPERFRVNVPLSNLPAFAQAFSCPAQAAMVRPAASRCAVW